MKLPEIISSPQFQGGGGQARRRRVGSCGGGEESGESVSDGSVMAADCQAESVID